MLPVAVQDAVAPVDVNGNGITDAGDTIAFTFAVANTGNTPLENVAVDDAMLSPTPIACTPATLPVGGSASCGPVVYTITAADVANGSVDNTATATGTPPGGTPVTSAPSTTTTPTTPPAPALTTIKRLVGNADADGNGTLSVGDVLTYEVVATNSGNVPLVEVVVADARIVPGSATCPLVAVGGTCTLTGTYVVAQADVDAGRIVNTALVTTQPPPGSPPLPPEACPVGSADARCAPSLTLPIVRQPAIDIAKTAALTTDGGTAGVGNSGDVITWSVVVRNTGNTTLTGLVVTDTYMGGTPTTLTCTPTTLAPGQQASCASYSHVITVAEANAGAPLTNSATATATSAGDGAAVSVSDSAVASVTVEGEPAQMRIVKTASPRDVRIGDLVRYQVSIQNTGTADIVDATLVDTPPAGFSLVEESLTVADGDNAGRLVGTFPVRVDRIDIAAGQRATVQYLLRVGAGVRAGVHTNTAVMQAAGAVASNTATADVQLVADPMLDESLVLGTVYDDRDGDGWQDPATLTGVRVRGGFAAGAYVAGTTTLSRDGAEAPVADASAPLLHGIALGDIGARQSDADPAARRAVVVSQLLREAAFTGDFELTTADGHVLRMDAAGRTTVEAVDGDAKAGRHGGVPTVSRRVAQVEGGVRVDYVITNDGVDERGIPGVRIATVEGLLVETDPRGRYHLAGLSGGRWERGRNVILKVDPATLPAGTVFTTPNPLVKRVTPGLPVRFDFGATLPKGLIEGGSRDVEVELGSVLFHAESATFRGDPAPVVDGMAQQLRAHGGGTVVVTGEGGEALGYARARAVQDALLATLSPAEAAKTTVELRATEGGTLAALGATPVLGTVLFETDRDVVRPRYAPVIAAIARDIAKAAAAVDGPLVVGVVGHADRRGSDAYNVALGLRRARAVHAAIAAQLEPEVRARLRVDVSDDPTAPAGDQAEAR